MLEALLPLWEASDRLCGKRLQALLPLLVTSLERHGHLSLEPDRREKVLAMSSATIDRLLAPVRKATGGNGWRRPPLAYSAVRRRVPVRTFKGWEDHHDPGWLEIDLVAHCGGRMEGRFLWTLVATDIATGWSESLPLLQRDSAVVLMALQLIRQQQPFPLRGIDADNDPVFMNTLMEAWCDRPEDRIKLTRSQSYHSNDQAWVEQKNGVLVRRVVGYERLVGLEAARLLGELYAALRLFTNLFQPSFKLKSSVREGGRNKRQHHPPRTPLQLPQGLGCFFAHLTSRQQPLQRSSDPMALLETIRRCQAQLALLSSGQQASNPGGTATALVDADAENRSLESFLSGLQLLWKESQPRPKRAKPRTGKRTRIDPFEADAERIRQWVAEETIVTPKELMERLIEQDPERYGKRHLRTIQRRVSGYRLAQIDKELQETLEARQGPDQPMERTENAVLPGVKSIG